MDKKTLNIVLGAALLGSFFLAYFSMFGRSISGFDMATADGGDWQKYLLFFFILGYMLIQIQIRLEETFLTQQHSHNYLIYKQKVRRFL